MRILTVNVNTTESMTHSIAEAARAAVGADTEIIGVTPTFGAPSVEGNMESYLAATAVMDAVTRYDGEFDAVVLAGFGEHGKEGLMELLSVPVVDMTEAAAHVAMLLGSRFSVITTLDRAVPLIEDRLLTFGLDRRCAAVRSTGLGVLELEDADVAKQAITEHGRTGPRAERAPGSPGRRRSSGRRDARRRPCAPGADHLQDPNLRTTAPQVTHRLAPAALIPLSPQPPLPSTRKWRPDAPERNLPCRRIIEVS